MSIEEVLEGGEGRTVAFDLDPVALALCRVQLLAVPHVLQPLVRSDVDLAEEHASWKKDSMVCQDLQIGLFF
jgi:hypothetical protein